jgi:DNA polymerase III gamma/tau subunit
MANGSMRDGLSLLDRLISAGIEPLSASLLEQYLGCPNSEKICNLIGQIGDSDAAGTLDAIEDLIGTGLGEVQIVDSLIDYMRDLMVVKSTGPDSKLVILTEQQRKRAGELAEKFDIAALIYNIAALEKLRWAVKNSDTSRALLEASLLRFALSEHFLNIDKLLSQLKGGSPATVKKKVTPAVNSPPAGRPQLTDPEPQETSLSIDIRSIKDRWPSILKLLDPGTGGLLVSAVPSRFENGILTLEFGQSNYVQKSMCERNGRIEQIEALLSEQLSRPVKLKLETAAGKRTQTESGTIPPKTGSQRRNEIINDPAVKTVLMGLDATITGIEEDKDD